MTKDKQALLDKAKARLASFKKIVANKRDTIPSLLAAEGVSDDGCVNFCESIAGAELAIVECEKLIASLNT